MEKYSKQLEAKQALSNPEAALKSDISGCFGLKVRRLPSFLVSVVVRISYTS